MGLKNIMAPVLTLLFLVGCDGDDERPLREINSCHSIGSTKYSE